MATLQHPRLWMCLKRASCPVILVILAQMPLGMPPTHLQALVRPLQWSFSQIFIPRMLRASLFQATHRRRSFLTCTATRFIRINLMVQHSRLITCTSSWSMGRWKRGIRRVLPRYPCSAGPFLSSISMLSLGVGRGLRASALQMQMSFSTFLIIIRFSVTHHTLPCP